VAEGRKNKELNQFLDDFGLLYWELDPDFTVVFVNNLALQKFGNVVGRTCFDVLMSRSERCPDCPVHQVLNGTQTIDCETCLTSSYADRSWIRHTAMPLTDTRNKIIGIRGIMLDVTEYKKAQEWVIDSEHHYRNLIEEVPDVIFALDPAGNFIFVNTQVENLLGYEVQRILETPLKGHVVPEHRDKIQNLLSLSPESIWDEEIAILDSMGNKKFTRIRCKGSFTENRKLLEIEGVMRDRTRHKSLEEELKASKSALIDKIKIIDDLYEHIVQSGKCKAIEEHTAEVAHELRQPLAIVGGFARRLERHLDSGQKQDEERQKQYLGIIITEIQRLEKILDRLIDFTKRTAITKRNVDPNDLIEYILGMTQARVAEKGLEIDITLGNEIGEIPLDPGRFQQLVLNLISNAIEASPPGGTIYVATGVSLPSDKALKAGQFGGSGFFEMKIRNNGPVIPPEALQNVFNPFFTTKQHGTGLGLTVCKKIVEDHLGSISVKSDGNGTVFTIWLPLTDFDHGSEQ
jgi:PAS domain S-box-containing protein